MGWAVLPEAATPPSGGRKAIAARSPDSRVRLAVFLFCPWQAQAANNPLLNLGGRRPAAKAAFSGPPVFSAASRRWRDGGPEGEQGLVRRTGRHKTPYVLGQSGLQRREWWHRSSLAKWRQST